MIMSFSSSEQRSKRVLGCWRLFLKVERKLVETRNVPNSLLTFANLFRNNSVVACNEAESGAAMRRK